MISGKFSVAASCAAEKPGVEVNAPDKIPDQNSGPYSGVKRVQITATKAPESITIAPITI